MLRDLRKTLREQQRQRQNGAEELPPPEPLFAQPPAHTPFVPTVLTDAQRAQLDAVAQTHPRLHASLARLNPEQLLAVLSDDPAALVRAQVGSGKTAVLVHKVLWLHLVQGVPMERIAVLTFTHKAAGEIRTRIEALAAETGQMLPPQAFWLTGTFHGVARSLLRQALPVDELGWKSNFGVLDEAARTVLCVQLIAEHGLNVRYVNRLPQRLEALRQGKTRIGAMKNDDDLPQLVTLLTAAKKERNVLDFADLLDAATWLLQEHALPVAPLWLVVDEFQDCDPRELAFIEALRGNHAEEPARFFAVGDPHQVIYAWRGSSPRLFDDVEARLRCVRYELPVNYRSTHEILEGARAILGCQGAQSLLHSERGEGKKIVVRRHHNGHMEGLYLAQRIRDLQATGVPLREIAVLFRMRRQAQAMHETLTRAGVACVEPSRASADERPAVAWLRGVLRLALGQPDVDAARALLVHPQFGVLANRQWNQRSLQTFAQKKALTGIDAVLAFLQQKSATRDRQFAVLHLQRWLDLAAWLAVQPLDGLETRLFDHLELQELLRPTSARHEHDVADARMFLNRLVAWQTAHGQAGLDGWQNALDLLALGGLNALGETADPALDAVALLTLHAAKGLEFRQVFISGCNQGVIPLTSAWGDAEVEAEERRLLFVGLTRAKDGVELSYHNQPAHPQAAPVASPYLYQLPAHTVDWQDRGQDQGQDRRQEDVVAPRVEVVEAPVEDLPWPVGMQVRHPRYGVGIVTVSGVEAVEVKFEKLGERSFERAFCPLVALG